MPSMRWAGVRWHLSSDALALAGGVLLVVNAAWLAAYAAIVASLGRPQPCDARGEHRAVVWGLLGFLALNVVSAAAMVWVGTRGTPLQPSRRRWMGPLMYFQAAKWLASVGYIAFCFQAVYTLPNACWQDERRGLIQGMLWSTTAIFAVLGLAGVFSYNALASKDPAARWEIRLKWMGRILGCYSLLTQPPPSGEENTAQRAPPIQELSRFMARSFGAIDVEKTDVLAGMYLAAAMLSQQRLAAGLSLMHAAGVLRGRRVHAEQAEPADTASAASQCLPEDQTAAGMPAGAGMATGAQHMQAEGRHPGQGRPSANGLGANGKSGEHAGQPTEVAIPIGDNEEAFWVWLRGICQRPKFLLEPPARAALAAPNLSPQQLAAACCGRDTEAVPRRVLEEAEHWAWHALAAYGKQSLMEHTPHPWLTRLRLLRSVYPRSRAARRALPPVRDKVKESRQYARHYFSAKKLVGYRDEDVVYVSFSDSFLGAVPYGIVLDRQRRAVVVTIRGTASMASLLSDLSEKPEGLSDWLPPAFREAHSPALDGAQGHSGILSAAKGVLADLNRHQILHILLTGRCGPESNGQQEAGDSGAGHGEPRRTPKDYQDILERRGLDCRGWALVLCGHSLGAGIAALLAPHFRDWWPDVHAWAFCPPGGMVTPNLAAALDPLVTCVVVGKDAVSRTSTATFERLQDQVVVALARCRVTKLRVLLTGRSRWLRRLPASQLFSPPELIPKEALTYLRSYFEGKQQYKHLLVHMEPPGRCALLRRLRKPGAADRGHSFEAVWVQRQQLIQEGLLLSKHMVKDHYTSTLTAALSSVLQSGKATTAESAGQEHRGALSATQVA
ncbi:hypothetical protein ABPG77_009275 [Micractinium sp. CCAP 211/92]